MTPSQIEALFHEVIQEKAIYNKLEGISRNTVFNWVSKRTIPSIGDMLGVLYQLKKISILDNNGPILNVYSVDKKKKVDTIEGLNKLPEIVENMFGKKRTLSQVTRNNSNEPTAK